MSTIRMITAPLIGAAIGYFTNYIAVKMLFRPLHPIKIGKYTLPFTPGIIPKGKDRLAKAIGTAVGENLLTEDMLRTALLNDTMQQNLLSSIHHFLDSQKDSETTWEELARNYLSAKDYEQCLHSIRQSISQKIYEKLWNANVGKIIAERASDVIKEKSGHPILSFVLQDSFLQPILNQLSDSVNVYIKENGNELVENMVQEELLHLTNTTIGNGVMKLQASPIQIDEILLNIYRTIIDTKLCSILQKINISHLIEEKISEMDVLETETLLLTIMEKELNAIVRLGALIGFLLGLLNLLF